MTAEFDVAVIGAGIAGASAAAELAGSRRVVVLERESFPGHHSTGRSAALFSEIYGSAPVRALSRASRDFLYDPPDGFSEAPLVRPRGALHIATAAQLPALERFASLPDVAPSIRPLEGEAARELCPILREGHVARAALELGSADIDVNALHQGYLRRLRAQGGEIRLEAEVLGLSPTAGGWRIETSAGAILAPVVVNAAGAWADRIAALVGAAPIGLQPRRRTALIVEAPPGADPRAWPMVIDVDEQFYFRPDGGGLLLSPGDETPCEPCDAQPEELDVAIAVERVEAATTLEVRRVRRSWAGLRSFVGDRAPVVGFAADAPGFFWLAGQGGYGIQTAPAMGALAAALVRGEAPPAAVQAAGVDLADLAPARLADTRRMKVVDQN